MTASDPGASAGNEPDTGGSGFTPQKILMLLAAAAVVILGIAWIGGAFDGDDESADDDTTETTDPDDETDPDETTPEGGALKVALVAPSASDDLAFTQSMVDAINALDRDIDLSVTDSTFVVDEAAAAIRGYAEDGNDVVIVHGTQFGASLEEIAPDFPEVSFIWGTATDPGGLANVFAYYPQADQGGYVEGVVASQITTTGVIGVVGPVEAGDAVAYINGFAAGAEANGATVNITYTGSFSDVALAAEAAQAHLTNDVDVLTGSAQMVVGAVGVAAENDVPWFGTQANQTPLAPDLVVASQVYHWEVVLEEMLALRDGGTLGGQAFVINLENGGLEVEFNDGYTLPDGVREMADATIAGIIDGSISTGG